MSFGSESQRVVAERGARIVYHVSSGSRDHVTISYTVSANGQMIPPRVVLKVCVAILSYIS